MGSGFPSGEVWADTSGVGLQAGPSRGWHGGQATLAQLTAAAPLA